ncbi:hypothetical protein BCR42DRAFT_425392 [Absidia repens]|uniref:Gamma interferon inducible lysosomal thiol reductase-domain-containing protein n=1 Tax=Absidia repens TaxID=90262 RepID=A0A1X2I348_9FUNG|nr:hypothetical protein BCR42DRAFT_425392 [Absidia repens]
MYAYFVVVSLLSAYVFALPSFHKNVWKEPVPPVPIDLFVMSKCPDAVYCEAVFSSVLKKVSVPVTLDINYIAQYDGSDPFEHSCKHGVSECFGNIQQLCFKYEYPDREDWFAFDLCLNKRYKQIGLNNNLALHCAKEGKKSYDRVDKCSRSSLGIGLLTESAQKTKALGVRSSCTVFIDQKLRCIHDGSWKNCPGGWKIEDFIRTIEDAYHAKYN